jgi:hypothetical protein
MRRRRAMRHSTRRLAGQVSQKPRRPSRPTTAPPAFSLPLQGSVGAGGGNAPDDVRGVKRRLIALGFNWLSDDTSINQATIRTISLFQAITRGFQRVDGAPVDGLIEVGRDTHRWLEASNAPRWRLMPAGGAPEDGFRNTEVLDQTGDDHDWGTEWLARTITDAGATYRTEYLSEHPSAAPITVNDVSTPRGGPTPDHQTHQTGMCCDVRVARTDGTAPGNTTFRDRTYDRGAMRAMLSALRAQPLVRHIVFNDPVLIREGLCTALAGHDDHVHAEITAPAPGAPEP